MAFPALAGVLPSGPPLLHPLCTHLVVFLSGLVWGSHTKYTQGSLLAVSCPWYPLPSLPPTYLLDVTSEMHHVGQGLLLPGLILSLFPVLLLLTSGPLFLVSREWVNRDLGGEAQKPWP